MGIYHKTGHPLSHSKPGMLRHTSDLTTNWHLCDGRASTNYPLTVAVELLEEGRTEKRTPPSFP